MNRCAAFMLALLLLAPAVANAENWPSWRGPDGQSVSNEKGIPLTWSDSENVKWKIPLADQGNSSPVVWNKRIFLTQANKDGLTRSLLCFNREDGKELWNIDVEYTEKERNWNPNWYANASPVTDGERVIVSFGSAGMFCYDFEGKELWKRTDLGTWDHAFGNSSSPILYGDLAILWCGPNEKMGRNYLLAVDKKTGKTAWEHDEKNGSWGTPLITKIDGEDQLLLSTIPYLKGIDPRTGKDIWWCEGLNKYVYTSPLYRDGFAVAMSGYNGADLAVKVGGKGDITSQRLWQHPQNIQRVGTGVLHGGHVYMMEENGVPHCYDVQTGAEVWKVEKRPGGGKTWGSMVLVEERLYVMMSNAETLVFAAKPEYELLATNSLGRGNETNSTPAISDGQIFLRTFKHLWCIEKDK